MPAIPYPGSMPRLHNCRKKKTFRVLHSWISALRFLVNGLLGTSHKCATRVQLVLRCIHHKTR